MHLAQRSGRRGLVLKALELGEPAGAELGRHAALDERPAHRRRVGLELLQLLHVLLGQRVGDGGHDLGHLHEGPLEAAERGLQLRRVLGAVDLEAEIALPGDARRQPANRTADAGVAHDAPAQGIALACHRDGRAVTSSFPARR
jgi:hypothetical protein